MPPRILVRFILFGPFALLSPENRQAFSSADGRRPGQIGMVVWAVWVIGLIAFSLYTSSQVPYGFSVHYTWEF